MVMKLLRYFRGNCSGDMQKGSLRGRYKGGINKNTLII
jgi:hypothetical protein